VCGLAQGVWFDNPLNDTTESGGAAEVVSVYFLDLEAEGSEHYVGEVPYTSTLLIELEEIAFTETTMVRVWRYQPPENRPTWPVLLT